MGASAGTTQQARQPQQAQQQLPSPHPQSEAAGGGEGEEESVGEKQLAAAVVSAAFHAVLSCQDAAEPASIAFTQAGATPEDPAAAALAQAAELADTVMTEPAGAEAGQEPSGAPAVPAAATAAAGAQRGVERAAGLPIPPAAAGASAHASEDVRDRESGAMLCSCFGGGGRPSSARNNNK